ncbi:MAG TPA: hypothetical protein VN660_03290 [Steroidobacteraceae bacterium]|nr:hypothetical protein [Steroidobacteraceae bacterium]
MSVAYVLQTDQSAPLAKRFAHLAFGYFDHLEAAQKPDAKIPLENLFRLLEMYRHEAFSDEPSGGIANLDHLELPLELQSRDAWHIQIRQALVSAFDATFGQTPKDRAIGEVQGVLRWLSSGKNEPAGNAVATTRDFLRQFELSLG